MVELKTEKEFKEEFRKAKKLVKMGRIASGRLNRLIQFLPHGEEGREEFVRKFNVLNMTEDIIYSYETYIEKVDTRKNRTVKEKVRVYRTVERVPQVSIIDIMMWMNLAKNDILAEMKNK